MPSNGPKNILLVGGESAGLQALRLLDESPHHVVGVMAVPARDAREPGLWNAALKLGIECLPAEQIRHPEFAAEICKREVDVLLNVHSLYLIPAAVLDGCRIGAYNLHPGPLPEYAGLDVPSWALYHGETSHGVTLHQMVSQVDAGLIAYQARFDLRPTDTGLTVMSRCVREGLPLVKSLLADLDEDPAAIPQITQDLSRRRCFYRQPPDQGLLNWDRPAHRIVNHVRAADYSPFPSPWGHPTCLCNDQTLGIIQAAVTDVITTAEPGTVGDATDNGILVAANDFWINVRMIEVDGVKQQAAAGLARATVLRQQADSAAPGETPASAAAR